MGKVRVIFKKLCFLFINVLVLMSVHAQDTTLMQRFDLKTKNLNKSEMKTKVLYDRVYPFAKLNKQLFAKKERDVLPNDYQYWKQVYLEMYNASYENLFKHNLPDLQMVVLEEKIHTSKIPVAFIHYQYEYIDSNAYIDGRLEIKEGELFSKNNTSPFILDTINTLSVLADELQTGEVKIYFNDLYYFTNCQEKINEISFRVNDGNPIRLKSGDSTILTFYTPGTYTLSYIIFYADGTDYRDSTTLKVVNAGSIPCEYKTGSSTQTFLDYENKLAGCNYELGFYYNTCEARSTEQLFKPILVLDGFDPSDTRKVGNIYDLMNAQPVQLASYLRAQGHDLIIMNFPKGADYLERNALGVMQMIEYIKARTQDQIIVIGPSMGGLLAKYAIATLEKNNIAHQVGLYVSFDAPHQGANIPIGAQYFLKFFGENIGNAAALEGLQKIKSPAARQMLIHHYLRNSVYPMHDTYRNRYKLVDTKYPEKSRNVSLINGAENSKEQGLMNELFSLHYTIFFNQLLVADAKVYKSSSTGSSVVADLFARNPNKLFIKENMYKLSAPGFNNPHPSSLDNAPGGTYNTQYQLTHDANGTLMDGFKMNIGTHCFIPSVSALDVQSPDGFVNYTMDIKNAELICHQLIPFVAYHASNTNEEHVAIQQHSADWIKRELRNGNRKTELTSAKTIFKNNEVYNYGANTKDFYSKPFSFTDGALLGVNMNRATGYANEAVPFPVSQFTVDGYNASCTTLVMEIANRAKIQLGDVNKNIGILKISENSQLYLHDEAELLIHDYSTLIIEKGSSLLIGKNVKINLVGKNAKIIVHGKLEVEQGASFTFIGDGFLVLNTNEIILQQNAHINIKGKNKNDLKLQVLNGNKIPFPFQENSNSSVNINNAKVQFLGEDSYINLAIPVSILESTIEGGRGFILNGQKEINIKYCEFSNNKTAITYYANNMEAYYQNPLPFKLSDNTFINCRLAINCIGKGFELKNLRMLNIEKAIVANEMAWPSYIIGTTISASENQTQLNSYNAAINYYGQNGSSVSIISSSINDFNIGVFVHKASLNLSCSEILNCQRNAIYLYEGASLNMSRSTQQAAGNNTLSIKQAYNNALICLDQAGTIRLENGSNKFKLSSRTNVYFIAGTSKFIPSSLNVKQNNWYTNSYTYENNPSAAYFYISLNTAPSSPRVQNYILLPILGNNQTYDCNATAQINAAVQYTANTNECIATFEQDGFLNKEKYYQELSHRCALENFAYLASINNSNPELLAQKQKVLQEYKYYASLSNDTSMLFSATINLANYYVENNVFETGFTLLNEANFFSNNTSSSAYVTYLSCNTQIRKEYTEKKYSLVVLDSLLQNCSYEFKPDNQHMRLNKNYTKTMEVKPIDLIPNPTDRIFDVVVNDDAKIFSVSVFSPQGELLSDFAVTHTDKVVRVDLEGFSPGLYLVNIKTSEKEYIRKIILMSPK